MNSQAETPSRCPVGAQRVVPGAARQKTANGEKGLGVGTRLLVVDRF